MGHNKQTKPQQRKHSKQKQEYKRTEPKNRYEKEPEIQE